ncbi:ribonuclease III [Candidatus Falkowbacteria bacterium HGW-Falkowbacteria-1]|uniref:Ribonuclease 3 n=1 Tax=Candidatus Falkowbacteria bacterium HGW-Falkowbacteria-1 TaxID=2013768 RepID=A0A2N2E8P2_9BACT|nr:MAG: ribonuclease III [Candidatus Falkowbacteria bacterium HGW-Falkowbacteria-1]
MSKLKDLEEKIGVFFDNKNLLQQALIHRSYLNENHDFHLGHNERLEFLGDAVLEIIITEYLFINFPNNPEGDLTNWRASLVNSKMLYQVAKDLGVEEFILLSKGEAKDKNSKARQYILANSIEAIIGAIYLDQGIEKSKDFVFKNIVFNLKDIIESKSYLDPKSRFQESSQEKASITPVYKVLKEEGPDHDKKFTVGLFLEEEMVSMGFGSSKQEAQVDAAEKGLTLKNW